MNNLIDERILEKNLELQFVSHLPKKSNTNIIKQKRFQYPVGEKKYIKICTYTLLLSFTFYTPVFAKPPAYYRFTSDIYKQDEKIISIRKSNPNVSEEVINEELLNELLKRKENELEKNCLNKIKTNVEDLEKQLIHVKDIEFKNKILSSLSMATTGVTNGLAIFAATFTGGAGAIVGYLTAGAAASVVATIGENLISNKIIHKIALDNTPIGTIVQEMRNLEKEYKSLKDGLKHEPTNELESRYVQQKRYINKPELEQEIERSLIQARVADYYFQLNTPAIGYALGLPLKQKPLLDKNDDYKSKKDLIARFNDDKIFSVYTKEIKESLLNTIIRIAINSITTTIGSPLRVVEHWLGTGSTGKSTAAKEIARFLGLPYFEKRITNPGAEINMASIFGAQRPFQGSPQLGWLAEALLQQKGQESYQNAFLILDDFPVNDPNGQSFLLTITDHEKRNIYNEFLQANLDISMLNQIIISNDPLKSSKPKEELEGNDDTFEALKSRFRTIIFPTFTEKQKEMLLKPYLEKVLVNKYTHPFFYNFNYIDPTQFKITFNSEALSDMGLPLQDPVIIATGVNENQRNAITVRELKELLEVRMNAYLNALISSVPCNGTLNEVGLNVAALKGNPEAITTLVKKKMELCDDAQQKKELMRRLGSGHEKSGNINAAKKCWIESFINLKDEEIWSQVSKHLPNKIVQSLDQQLLESLLTFLKADQTKVHRFAEGIRDHLYQIWLQSTNNPIRDECLKYSAALGNQEAFKEIETLSKNHKENLKFFYDLESLINENPVPYSKAFKILGDIYNEGTFVDFDLNKPLSYYEKAKSNGGNSFSYNYSIHYNPCLLTCNNGENGDLAFKGIEEKNSYQWAYFSTSEYLNKNKDKYSNKVILIKNEDNTYSIQSNFGEKSYLTVDGVVKEGGWQWAYFATQEYLDNHKNCNKFDLIKNEDSTYSVQSNFGEKSYLAVDGALEKNGYQWAFFATHKYLNSGKASYANKVIIKKTK